MLRYFGIALSFSMEIVGIAVFGMVIRHYLHISANVIVIGVGILMLLSFVKFLWMFSKMKSQD